VLEELGLGPSAGPNAITPDREPAADGVAGRVLAALGYDPAGIDMLTERTGLPTDAVAAALVELELSGRVATLPGGNYQRLR
jgi:DNA processing protein